MSRNARSNRARAAKRTQSRAGAGSPERAHAEPAAAEDPTGGHIPGVGAMIGAGADADGCFHEGGAPLNAGLGAQVLVLNRSYMATRVISAKRAFVLLAREAAEVIHADDGSYANYDLTTWAELSELHRQFEPELHDWVRTVRFDIAVPRIIRLIGYDKLPAQRVKLNRRNLFARDHNQCQYCGSRFPTSELSIDHVVPRTQSGPDTWENLVCACVRCNSRKGGRTPAQAHMKLVRKPVRPRRNPLISVRLSSEKYASWKAFLDEAYWSVELR